MPQKITEEAILTCDKGATFAQLKVTSQNFCKAAGKLIATEKDKEATTNIPAFGECSITKNTCEPAISNWEKTAMKDAVNKHKILTDESICECATGGKISVQKKGHNENHEIK
ncbi:DUF4280 domain-containing protein [Chitinophagaceae bacterium 26-R-25]|nr:DUF4280 domain-containing protein [Chitinophagaceae bacterium 26-R-25]